MIEKEAQVWHMDTKRHKEGYFQCAVCGNIHREYMDEVIDTNTDIFYATVCSRCRKVQKHLFVGENESEIIELYNPVLDLRYY